MTEMALLNPLVDATYLPAISIDLDGVVMQNRLIPGVWPRLREHLQREITIPVAEIDAQASQLVELLHYQRMSTGNGVAAYDWDSIYAEIGRYFGIRSMPNMASLVGEYCKLDGLITLLPGVVAGLTRLRELPIRLIALTNGFYAYQWPALEALGITHFFHDMITPDRAGYIKPDTRMFQRIPNLRAHIGDTLLQDVLGANRAGVMSIWLDAALPQQFHHYPAEQRPSAPGFADYLEAMINRSEHRKVHPAATLAACMPDAVAIDFEEAAMLLVRNQLILHLNG
jgi:putative hydrolase of the HAD superfamily